MQSATRHLSISAVCADTLFASAVQRSDKPSAAQIRQAITAAVRASRPDGATWRLPGPGHPDLADLGARARPARASATTRAESIGNCETRCTSRAA
jgi:hypothetical protein